jgi:hypothetical protein
LHLVEIEPHEFFPAQAGREQHKDDRPIAPRSSVRMDGILKSRAMPTPFDQMKAFQPVTEVLERADLVVV